ncbi:MAG: transcriptional repressor [Proteobacteria bacterium]|nr:transcriptional repressor [Pseudomonadota bacterium]MBU1583897.1 transcriptional repressor [Pseudomonadota bacterium]MBU2451935.1 transcriptional repressor [Pseudomonadota bacterium]MBU2628022.1 transcriptional repressor [Pseudomonadota bacterium]
MELFFTKCKQHHLKITPQRIAVYKALKDAVNHPSADAVHKKIKNEFPNISLDTVNRTLLTFSEINIIAIVEGQGDPRRFDPNLDSHHHFYCLSCNEIFDVYDEALNAIKIPETIENKFTITGKRLCLQGFCNKCNCREKGKRIA